MKENQIRHNKNLHGETGVDGLTGFYHGQFYDNGQVRKKTGHELRSEANKDRVIFEVFKKKSQL